MGSSGSGDQADDWAICCSGGGIRSAAYCLGALQSLDAGGLLAKAKAKWILGVSGGSYIATSRALVAHDLPAGAEPHAYAPGTFSRLQEGPGRPQQGQIWVCKLGWWTGAPWDVLAYARNHPSYPCDSTLDQLYDATEFEAYHELGVATVLAAATQCTPPLRWVAAPVGVPAGRAAADPG